MTTTRDPGTNRGRTPQPPEPNRGSRPGQPDGRAGAPKADSGPAVVVGVRKLFAAETPNFFLLLGTTVFLVAFGLVMVLSSSSVESHLESNDFFASFSKQGLFALLGVPLMLMASRMPMTFWKRWAWPAIFVGMGLQLLVFVPGIGWGYGGNQNWIRIGGISAQPSEVLKLAVIVWIAFILTTKPGVLDNWKQLLLTIGPVAGAAIGLVLFGQDLGTVVVMALIVYACVFIAGVKVSWLLTSAVLIGSFGILFAFSGESRTERINAWIKGCTTAQYETFCWQPTHGKWALASGGFFGVGLGNSKAKWSWLPEADNDYIFAIVGEELGLIGAVVVLVLFIVLAFAFIRIIRSNNDPFARIVTAGVGIWIVGQAFINIAVVLGVLPVLGVPLPLISAGGSALIATLLAIGVVLSFAREASPTADQPLARPAGIRDDSAPRGRRQNPQQTGAPVAQTPAERSRLAAAQRAESLRSSQNRTTR
jgi:cell division protein FtsW